MLLACAAPPPVGARRRFELSVPGGEGRVTGDGECVRHARQSREHILGFALRFTRLSAAAERRLNALLDGAGAAALADQGLPGSS